MERLPIRRRKLLVQKPIQGGLVVRCVFYWFFCLCTILLFVTVASMFSGDLKSAGEMFGGIWKQFSPAILASVLLLPFVAADVVRLSHRFVGPLVRLENELKRLADGEQVRPVNFRKKDYWHGLALQFNRIASLQRQLQEQIESSDTADETKSEYETTG